MEIICKYKYMEIFFAVLVGVGFGYIFFLMRKDPEEKKYIKEKTDEYIKIQLKNSNEHPETIARNAHILAQKMWDKFNS
jgi:hypothetical protein